MGTRTRADDHADHGTEGSLDIASGKLVVMGSTDFFPEARRISLPKGTYRVRILHLGLRKKERIALQSWPAAMAAPDVAIANG